MGIANISYSLGCLAGHLNSAYTDAKILCQSCEERKLERICSIFQERVGSSLVHVIIDNSIRRESVVNNLL